MIHRALEYVTAKLDTYPASLHLLFVGLAQTCAPTSVHDKGWVLMMACMQRGVSIDHPIDDKGNTTLMTAVSMVEHVDESMFLLDHGACVNASNDDGVTCLQLLATYGRSTLTRRMLEAGHLRYAHFSQRVSTGDTILEYAARSAHSNTKPVHSTLVHAQRMQQEHVKPAVLACVQARMIDDLASIVWQYLC